MSDHGHLPSSYSERVTFGLKIAHDAYQARIHELESEVRSLSHTIEEYRLTAVDAQKRAAVSESSVLEAHRKIAELTEEVRQITTANKNLVKQVDRARKLQQTFAEALELQVRDELPLPPIIEDSPLPIPILRNPALNFHPAVANMSGSYAPIDGRAFFAEVRKVTTHDEFNRFLGAIKNLNTNASTREEVLAEARDIFGIKHPHLLRDFTALVNRPNH